jgi:hypothetical protein
MPPSAFFGLSSLYSPSPHFNHRSRLAQMNAPVFVQALVPQATVERVDAGILVRLADLNEAQHGAPIAG